MVLAFSDKDSVESWTLEGSADRMRAEFSGWEPKWVKRTSEHPASVNYRLQTSKDTFVCAINVQMEAHGPCPSTNVGPSFWPSFAIGGCLPPNAGESGCYGERGRYTQEKRFSHTELKEQQWP